MPTIIPPAFGLVAHHFRLVGITNPSGPMVCTYGVHLIGTDGQETLDTCRAYFGSLVQGMVNDDYECYFSTLKQGPNATGPTFENSVITQGGIAGAGATPATSYLIKKLTGSGGRANRGRMYVPGVTVSTTSTAGVIGTTALEDYQETADTFLAGLLTEGATPVILHSASSDPTTITSLVVESMVATQRRRQR